MSECAGDNCTTLYHQQAYNMCSAEVKTKINLSVNQLFLKSLAHVHTSKSQIPK